MTGVNTNLMLMNGFSATGLSFNAGSNYASSDSESGNCGTEEDSDEEPEEDEDEEEDGLNTQALIDQVETSFLDLLVQTVEDVEKNYDTSHLIRIQPLLPSPPVKQSRDEETQTDTPFNYADEEKVDGTKDGEDREAIRHEIASLRLTRESLVNQRKEVADLLKRHARGHENFAEQEKKVYEFEEAIEAIDSVIEYKNEAICGRECILSNCVAPGKNEADLVTRLTSMTTLDLQRLLCKYFSKVVEIRYSSKRLEKQMEELENHYEASAKMLSRNEKYLKEMQNEYDTRIKLLIGLNSKNSNTALEKYVHELDKKLSASTKRQFALQTALTDLLVRHEYLTNEADYEDKRVAKMLGLDPVQMGLTWRLDESKPKKKGGMSGGAAGTIPSNVRNALQSGFSSQGLSRRMREAFDHHPMHQHQQSSSSSHHHRHHHHQHLPHGQMHHHSRGDTLPHYENHYDYQQHHGTTQEVRRKGKQKLYIQPRSASPHQP